MYSTQVTKHGEKRMRKRMGISKKSVGRIADKAFHLGIRLSELNGNFNKYVEDKETISKKHCYFIQYGSFLFIFERNILITVYTLPKYLNHYVS